MMRPALRPKLLCHLKDMLSEREEDIAALQARLRQSEELRGEPLQRLENLEAQLAGAASLPGAGGCQERFDAIEQRLCDSQSRPAARGLAPHEGRGEAAGSELQEQVVALQRFVDQLQEQLSVSNAGRHAIAGELARFRQENEELEVRLASAEQGSAGVAELRTRLASAERDASEVDALRAQFAHTANENQYLRQHLAAREADVGRLRDRIAELEAMHATHTSHRIIDAPSPWSSASPGGEDVSGLLGRGNAIHQRGLTGSMPLEETLPAMSSLPTLQQSPRSDYQSGLIPWGDTCAARRPDSFVAAHALNSGAVDGSYGSYTSPQCMTIPTEAGAVAQPRARSPGGAMVSPRLVRVSAASTGNISARGELRPLGTPVVREIQPPMRESSPHPASHAVHLSTLPAPTEPVSDGGAPLSARSQSVPVQVRRMTQPTSGGVGGGNVSLARWAAAPADPRSGACASPSLQLQSPASPSPSVAGFQHLYGTTR